MEVVMATDKKNFQTSFGIQSEELEGKIMTAVDNETAEERKFRVQEEEYEFPQELQTD